MIYQPRECPACISGIIRASEVAAGHTSCEKCREESARRMAERNRNAGLWRANERAR